MQTLTRCFPRSLPALLIGLGMGLGGCSGLTTVQEVQSRSNHGWFRSIFNTVSLQGTVGDRVPLIEAQVYQLQDSTGKIWVLTADRALESGDQVRIKGKIRWIEISTAGDPPPEVYIEQQELIEKNSPPN